MCGCVNYILDWNIHCHKNSLTSYHKLIIVLIYKLNIIIKIINITIKCIFISSFHIRKQNNARNGVEFNSKYSETPNKICSGKLTSERNVATTEYSGVLTDIVSKFGPLKSSQWFFS